jgi:hypothetical protein
MTEDESIRFDANGIAARAVPKAAAINWPYPADRRLDQLVRNANEAGAGTRRNELAAAIIAAATEDPAALLQIVIDWRRAQIKDVVLGVADAAEVIEIPRYRPGRRRANPY